MVPVLLMLDEDVIIDFKEVTTDKDVVTVIVTQPLTQDESWQQMEEGELCVCLMVAKWFVRSKLVIC